MAIIDHSPQAQADMILRILRERIAKNLEQEAIEAIRPAVRKVVGEVVQEMEPQIRANLDNISRELTLQLIFKDPAK